MPVLHITNGDSAADIIKASAVDGDVLPWRDPMHHGPFPDGPGLDELSAVRARYLAGPDLDCAEVERSFRLRDDHLRASAGYDRIVLWFEHDLLDQLQILQLLDWFSGVDLGETRLGLICVDRFDGVEPFRGIGELDTVQMASLLAHHQPVTRTQMDLARAGWSAFRSPDPRDLLSFMERDLHALPFLRAALARHLEEYPSYRSGLTRSERQILSLVSDGTRAPGRLFVENMAFETSLFIGDWPTFSIIAELCTCTLPLLYCDPDGTFRYGPSVDVSDTSFRSQRLRLTEIGEQVLAGRRDAFGCIERDRWLGGVQLRSGRPMWTWDAATRNLRLREP